MDNHKSLLAGLPKEYFIASHVSDAMSEPRLSRIPY